MDLPIEEYSKNKYTHDKLEYFCKDCRHKKHLEKKAHNNKVSLDYYRSHIEERKQKAREWKLRNKEAVRAMLKRWRTGHLSENRVLKNFRERRRRIAKNMNGGFHTLSEWEAKKREYGNRCACCWRRESQVKLTEDHIVSVSKGGRDDIENIQPLCLNCNSHKSTKEIRYLNPNVWNILFC